MNEHLNNIYLPQRLFQKYALKMAVTKNRMQPHAPHAPHATILGSMGSKNFAACSDSEKVLAMTKNLKWVIKPQKTSEEYEVPKNLIFH